MFNYTYGFFSAIVNRSNESCSDTIYNIDLYKKQTDKHSFLCIKNYKNMFT